MKRDFDPYAEWLKIPPARRPPSYYDVLGVPDDETDQRRVEEAASERVEKVRARALGEQGEHVTPILNEFARALDCLLDPDKRQAYDRQRLGEVVNRRLESDEEPADFYELLDLRRFMPDRHRLLWALQSARRQLDDVPQDGQRRGHRAARLLRALDSAEAALAGAPAFQEYHRPVLARLWDDYTEEHGEDPTLWDPDHLRAWLRDDRRVHSLGLETVARGMCDPAPAVWDQLLVELFPVGRVEEAVPADRSAGEAVLLEPPGEPAPLHQEPPQLPAVPGDEGADDEEGAEAGAEAERWKRVGAKVGTFARMAVQFAGRPTPQLVATSCLVVGLLTFGATVADRLRPPGGTPSLAELDPVARRELRAARFARATALLRETPPNYAAALPPLLATCRELPGGEHLEREYALCAWCFARMKDWPETWRCYKEARTRLGRAGRAVADASAEVLARLAEVRQSILLDSDDETAAVWEEIAGLEEELGGNVEGLTWFGELITMPRRPHRWAGELTRLVVYQGEVHVLLTLDEPGEGVNRIEAVADHPGFADQVCDYRSAVECGAADRVVVRGTLVLPGAAGAAAGTGAPAFRLQPDATLAELVEVQRIGDAESRARVGWQLRKRPPPDPAPSGLARYLRSPPPADMEDRIAFACYVSSLGAIVSGPADTFSQTIRVRPQWERGRSVEVRLVAETEIGIRDMGVGDRVLIDAKVVRSGPDELLLEAVGVDAAVGTTAADAEPERLPGFDEEKALWQAMLLDPARHMGETVKMGGMIGQRVAGGPKPCLPIWKLFFDFHYLDVPYLASDDEAVRFLDGLAEGEKVLFAVRVTGVKNRSWGQEPVIMLAWIARLDMPEHKVGFAAPLEAVAIAAEEERPAEVEEDWPAEIEAETAATAEEEAPPEPEPPLPSVAAAFRILAHAGAVGSVAWNPEGRYLATSGGQEATIWDPASATRIRTYGQHDGTVNDVAWKPRQLGSGRMVLGTASSDRYIRIFNVAPRGQDEPRRRFNAGSPVRCLTWRSDGEKLAAGLQSGELFFCDPIRGGGIQRRSSLSRRVTSVDWNPTSTELIASGGEEGMIWVWDPRKRNALCGRIDTDSLEVQALMVGDLELRTLIDLGQVDVVDQPSGPCCQLAWSPDGRRLAAAGHGLELLDFDPEAGFDGSARSENRFWIIEGTPERGATCVAVAWRPDGRYLACGTTEGVILVFNVSTGEPLRRLRVSGQVTSVAWNPGGARLAAGDSRGFLTVWDLPLGNGDQP